MAVTVVVSQVTPSDDFSALRIKGTVGGVAFLTALKNFHFDAVSMAANTLATYLLNRYNTIVNSFSSATLGPKGRTIALTVQDNRSSSVVFSNTLGTALVFLDYDNLEIVATVDSVATKIHMSQENYMEQQAGGQDMGIYCAQILYAEAQRVALQYASFIATFSI